MKKVYCIILAALLIVSLWSYIESNPIKSDFTMYCFDVGQADSTLFVMPGNRCMLIDAGNYKDGDYIAGRLTELGIKKIDYLVGTHPHADHLGGMSYIIKNFDIGKIYMPDAAQNTEAFEDVLKAIKDKNLSVTKAKSGVEILNENDLKIQIKSPALDEYSDLNDYSAVVRIKYKDTAFIVMGDAGVANEKEMIEDKNNDLSANVIRIGHHGSDTSTSSRFLNRVKPSVALISVGKGNEYGHPSIDVIKRLKDRRIKVYRTDKNGEIQIFSDGKKIKCYPKTGG
ncbi:MAG: ComEC/Rec2 family competence protein [Bacillota bacterium]|nr:ComEC/Rec2 family competence protein [Bacillota bacterium]